MEAQTNGRVRTHSHSQQHPGYPRNLYRNALQNKNRTRPDTNRKTRSESHRMPRRFQEIRQGGTRLDNQNGQTRISRVPRLPGKTGEMLNHFRFEPSFALPAASLPSDTAGKRTQKEDSSWHTTHST